MDWLDNVINEILQARDHQKLVDTINLTRVMTDKFNEAKSEMGDQSMDPSSSGDYAV